MEPTSLSSLRGGLIRCTLLICALISAPAMAASNYDELFGSGAPGWTPEVDSWSVTSGTYRNTSEAPRRAISVYGGDTWTTGYTYKVAVYSDYGAPGNQVGAIFGFVDTDNYYEVLVSMTGGVQLNRWSSGTLATLAEGQVQVPGSMPGIDQFFDITISRSGGTATVNVGPETAIANAALPTGAAGKIGVFTQYNRGRFDNVSVRLHSSNYNQNFSSGASGWSPAADAWSATSGYYTNGSSSLFRSISVYDGSTWSSNYTYQLRVYSDYDAPGNQVGAVFNYQDLQNYHEVVIDMSGNVTLSEVTSGARSTLDTGQVRVPEAVPGRDQWFTVVISRSGSSVSVSVGPDTAISGVNLPNVVPGRIGVLAKHNLARFDDIAVTGVTTPPPAFRSGFENNVILEGPTPIGAGDDDIWMLTLTGTESGTGTSWPPTFWGPSTNLLINTVLHTSVAPNTQTFANFLDVALKNVTGFDGSTTRVMSNKVKDVRRFPVTGGNHARAGIEYFVASGVTPPTSFYIRRYLRHLNVPPTWGERNYFVQHEYKSRGGCTTPRRLLVNWQANGSGQLHYWLVMDRANGCPEEDLPQESMPPCPAGVPPVFCPVFESSCYPGGQNLRHPSDQATACPAMPRGSWFWDEYFVRYSANGSSEDRVSYAINGTVVFDFRGPVKSPPHRGIKMTPGYTNVANIEVQADDVEVYNELPCASFPCGPPAHYQP